jgi:hypothetical protein
MRGHVPLSSRPLDALYLVFLLIHAPAAIIIGVCHRGSCGGRPSKLTLEPATDLQSLYPPAYVPSIFRQALSCLSVEYHCALQAAYRSSKSIFPGRTILCCSRPEIPHTHGSARSSFSRRSFSCQALSSEHTVSIRVTCWSTLAVFSLADISLCCRRPAYISFTDRLRRVIGHCHTRLHCDSALRVAGYGAYEQRDLILAFQLCAVLVAPVGNVDRLGLQTLVCGGGSGLEGCA